MGDDEFWSKLRDKYQSLSHGDRDWDQEKDSLIDLIPILQSDLSPRYEILNPLGVGGVGIALQVRDRNIEANRALKFPRPHAARQVMFAEIVASEISRLREASHPNIIEIYSQGEVSYSLGVCPYYVMAYIPAATDAFEYFRAADRTEEQLTHVIRQVCDGLRHLHSINVLHGDIKLENVLVAPDGRTVIADLGSARSLIDGPETVNAVFTRPYAHPLLLKQVAHSSYSDPNRIRAEVKRSSLRKSYDLYALGKNVRRIINVYDPTDHRKLTPYLRKYLLLLAARLLDGENSDDECALGLPRVAFHEIRYSSIDEVATDVRKITGRYSPYRLVPELDPHPASTIQTSSLTPTPFSERLHETIANALFRRLVSVSQLGFLNLIYPTATHSRFEHVLGTFTNAARYCNALYHDPINPLFKQIMTDVDMKALLLAALCHDLGQYPLAHDLEEIDADLFSHKELSIGLLEGRVLGPDVLKLQTILSEQWDVPASRVADIIRVDPTNLDAPLKDRILHTIVDGPIDADKLDYLVRDSENLSVPYGRAIDFERLLQTLTIVFKEQDQKVYAALGIHEKGRVQAETVAFVRYAMFGAVYWHHTSRAGKAMLDRAVWDSLPPKDQRDARRTFAEGLVGFVLGRGTVWAEQWRLFDSQEQFNLGSTQLQPGDQRMLEWLGQRMEPAGQSLLRMIGQRNLYKRILVISKSRNSRLWRALKRARDEYGWELVVRLEVELGSRVLQILQGLDDAARLTTSALGDESIERVEELYREVPLILVDIPYERPGTDISLEYLPESDRREILEGWRRPTGLEDSVIWTHLFDSFMESVGKMRVFCHPDIRETVEAAISKSQMESILEAAVQHSAKDTRMQGVLRDVLAGA